MPFFDQTDRILIIARTLVTLFVILLVPIYWKNYGVQNFLWFSDIGLLLTVIALWVKSPLLISMIVIGILPFEIVWAMDFIYELLMTKKWLGIVGYMFDPNIAIFLRGLSFFHLFLPLIWIWFLLEWGYDKRALWCQTILIWIVLPLTYFFTEPKRNINWVFFPILRQWHWMPLYVWLIILLIGLPVFILLPFHLFFKRFVKKRVI